MAMRTPEPDAAGVAGAVPARSGAVVGVLALLATLAVAGTTATLPVGVAGVAVGGLLALGIVAVDATDSSRSVLGGVGVLVAVTAAVGLPAIRYGAGDPVGAGVAGCGVLVGLGLATGRVPAIGAGAVSRTIGWLLRVGAITASLAILVAAASLDVAVLAATLTGVGPIATLITPASTSAAGISFIVVTLVAFSGLWLVLASLPPAEVVPPARRDAYRRMTTTLLRAAGSILVGGGILLGMTAILITELDLAADVLERGLVPLVTAPWLRIALLHVWLITLVLAALLWVLRSVGARLAFRRPAWLAGTAGIAVSVTLLAVLAGPRLPHAAVEPLGPLTLVLGPRAVAVLLAVLGILGLALALAMVPIATGLGLLPAPTAGPRLVVAGLFGLVIAGAAAGAPAILLLGVAAAAVVVWDVGEYAVGQTIDLGPAPARRDGEFVHAGASLLVGGITVLVTAVIYRLVTIVHVDAGMVAYVVILSAAAAIVAVGLLRG